ncbi:MAG: AAA family ATPase [Acidobacteriota bacterium]|nr:AAA family ATPase [Acidobacteriota bacterium]
MLVRIELEHFKSFAQQGVDLAPLTLLVGPNASGKSNLLEAVGFIHGLALGNAVHFPATAAHIRGSVTDVFQAGFNTASVKTCWQHDARMVSHELGLAHDGQNQTAVTRETLSAGGKPLAWKDDKAPSQAAAFKVDVGNGSKVSYAYPAYHSFLPNLGVVMATAEGVAETRAAWEVVAGALIGKVHHFIIDASGARGYAPKDQTILLVNGGNLSSVIFHLCNTGGKADLLDWLQELCAPELQDLDFMVTERDVMLVLVEKDGVRIPASILSDGTLRFLSLLTALYTVPDDSILLIEEIEMGLHPKRIYLLSELLENFVREKNLQIIATTHSPITLDECTGETLGNAVAFGRFPDVPGTVMKRLKDLPKFDELVAKRGIGDLFRTGWLERAL